MTIRYRPMQPRDVRQCVEMIAAHPVLGPRYGSAIADLHPAWLGLLGREAFTAVVFEDVERTGVRIWGVGASVFVSGDFLRELKTSPSFWIGPELAKRIVRGNSPVLSDRQVQEENSCRGLNLVVWEGCVCPEDLVRSEAHATMMAAYLEGHRGFRLKEAISAQAWAMEHLVFLLKTGAWIWNSESGSYVDSPYKDGQELISQPHVCGLTRELALKQYGSWAATLFIYQPPQFGFTPSEQRLLLAALAGGTDEDLSDQLGVALSTVKKTWQSVYNRVAERLPKLIPGNSKEHLEGSKRGREKKQRLLAYLREHVEELRPISRKPPQQSASPGRRVPKERPAR